MRRASNNIADWLALAGGAVTALWRWRLELAPGRRARRGMAAACRHARSWARRSDSRHRSHDDPVAAGSRGALDARAARRECAATVAARVARRRAAARRRGPCRQVPAGELVHVRCSRGSSIPHVAKHAEQLAACLGAREVRVWRDPKHAARGTALLVRRDPLDGVDADVAARRASGPLSLWERDPGRRRRARPDRADGVARAQPAPRRRAGRGQERGAVARPGVGGDGPRGAAVAARRQGGGAGGMVALRGAVRGSERR